MARSGFATIEFFAAPGDFDWLSDLVFQLGLAPVQAGLLQAPPSRWSMLSEFRYANGQRLGEWAKGPSANQNDAFLLLPPHSSIDVRSVPQRRSEETRLAVDLLENLKALYLSAGGVCQGKFLLPSMISCRNTDQDASGHFIALKRQITKQFVISTDRHYWIGPEAVRLLGDGILLSVDARCPTSLISPGGPQ
jgi:hypothetical protein